MQKTKIGLSCILLIFFGHFSFASDGRQASLMCSERLTGVNSSTPADLIDVTVLQGKTIGTGLFDTSLGRVVLAVAPPFAVVGRPSQEGLVRIQKVTGPGQALYGFINLHGEGVIDFKFVEAGDIRNETLVALESYDGEWAYYNVKNGFRKIPIPNGSKTSHAGFSEDRASVYIHDGAVKYAYIDRNGNLTTEFIYQEAHSFHHGLAAVKPVGSDFFGYINRAGEMVIQPQFRTASDFAPLQEGSPSSEFVAAVEDKNHRFGFIRRDGSFFISPRFAEAKSFREGLAGVKTEAFGPWGFINTKGDLVIAPEFFFVTDFSDGLAAVKTKPSGNWIYIDRSGARAFEGEFTRPGNFINGYAKVESGLAEVLIDRSGKPVVVADFSSILSGVRISWDALGGALVGDLPRLDGFPFEEPQSIPEKTD